MEAETADGGQQKYDKTWIKVGNQLGKFEQQRKVGKGERAKQTEVNSIDKEIQLLFCQFVQFQACLFRKLWGQFRQ